MLDLMMALNRIGDRSVILRPTLDAINQAERAMTQEGDEKISVWRAEICKNQHFPCDFSETLL